MKNDEWQELRTMWLNLNLARERANWLGVDNVMTRMEKLLWTDHDD